MNAYQKLMAVLKDGERVDGIVFGDWIPYFQSKAPKPTPPKRCVLTLIQAKLYLEALNFSSEGKGWGNSCYAIHIWTSQRILFVQVYDSATELCAIPRHPSSEDIPSPWGNTPEEC